MSSKYITVIFLYMYKRERVIKIAIKFSKTRQRPIL